MYFGIVMSPQVMPGTVGVLTVVRGITVSCAGIADRSSVLSKGSVALAALAVMSLFTLLSGAAVPLRPLWKVSGSSVLHTDGASMRGFVIVSAVKLSYGSDRAAVDERLLTRRLDVEAVGLDTAASRLFAES